MNTSYEGEEEYTSKFDSTSSSNTTISSDVDTSSFESTESTDSSFLKKPNFFKKGFVFSLLFVLCNLLFLVANVLIVFFVIVRQKKKPENSQNDNVIDNTNQKETYLKDYQLVVNDKTNDLSTNKIVQFEDIDFEGDFYPIEEENGYYGMIVKLDAKGEHYQMCASECKCGIECKVDDDCSYGSTCEKYQCVDYKRRKETDTEEGRGVRKVAQVVLAIPIAICTLGIFTSMFLAKEYADKFFAEECGKVCPPSAENVNADTNTEVKEEELRPYTCVGFCEFIEERGPDFAKFSSGSLEMIPEGLVKLIKMEDQTPFESWLEENLESAEETCDDMCHRSTFVATDLATAKSEFLYMLKAKCRGIGYDFTFQDLAINVRSHHHVRKICQESEGTVNCS